MYILLWIVVGGIIGWLASIITKNNSRMGIPANIVVGLIGSVIGGWIATLLKWGTFSKFSIGGLILALVGSVVLLLLINLFTTSRD